MGHRGQDEFDPANFGIFAGSEGLANVNTMEVEQTPDGYEMTRPCEGCGELRKCVIDWAEMYCLQYAVDPARVGARINRQDIFSTQWLYSPQHKCFHPNFRCNCMGNPVVLFNMTPVAAEAALRAAARNGILSDAQQNLIRHIAPYVKEMAGARNGVPARQMQAQYARAGGPPPGYPGVPVQQGNGGGFFRR